MRLRPSTKGDYSFFQKMTTRWRDNDVYGHMNNVVFYEYVDTTVNSWLLETGSLMVPLDSVIGLVVETKCTYFSEVGFPGVITTGLKVCKVGRSSINYEVGIFFNQFETSAARVSFTHVCVNSKTRKPVKIPKKLLLSLETIKMPQDKIV